MFLLSHTSCQTWTRDCVGFCDMWTIAHLRTNVEPWVHPTLQYLDETLLHLGSFPIDIEWDKCEKVRGDADHFTKKGYRAFVEQLVPKIGELQQDYVLIVSDSTIGHNDPWASTYLSSALQRHNITSRIDVVNGSGFVARASTMEHFRARLSSLLRRGALPTRGRRCVLFIGGWNDAHDDDRGRCASAALSCLNLIERF